MKGFTHIVGGLAAGTALAAGFLYWLGPAHGGYTRKRFIKDGEKGWTAHTLAIKVVRGESNKEAFAKTMQELADHNNIVICSECMAIGGELVHPTGSNRPTSSFS